MAAEKGHLGVVKCLVDGKADISIGDIRGVSITSLKKFLNNKKKHGGMELQKQPNKAGMTHDYFIPFIRLVPLL